MWCCLFSSWMLGTKAVCAPACVTWMSASGFSLLRISAASCCFSSSTMEAKVTGEERGGLPAAPSTQGLKEVKHTRRVTWLIRGKAGRTKQENQGSTIHWQMQRRFHNWSWNVALRFKEIWIKTTLTHLHHHIMTTRETYFVQSQNLKFTKNYKSQSPMPLHLVSLKSPKCPPFAPKGVNSVVCRGLGDIQVRKRFCPQRTRLHWWRIWSRIWYDPVSLN